ncbi:MAG: hypothetical protein HY756_11030 [Nitrospirae bacterium]|nr:hypothetical protein [Nitrospirota bacterium]
MKRITIILLFLAIAPYLFIIPLLCCPTHSSVSEEEGYQILPVKMIILRIMLLKTTGSMFTIPNIVTCPEPFKEFSLLKDIPQVITIPILTLQKDKPPTLY